MKKRPEDVALTIAVIIMFVMIVFAFINDQFRKTPSNPETSTSTEVVETYSA